MPDEIHECPFCGSVNGPGATRDGPAFWRVVCSVCGARGGSYATVAAAIEVWNRRHIACRFTARACRKVLTDCTRLFRERIALHNDELLACVGDIAESLGDRYGS